MHGKLFAWFAHKNYDVFCICYLVFYCYREEGIGKACLTPVPTVNVPRSGSLEQTYSSLPEGEVSGRRANQSRSMPRWKPPQWLLKELRSVSSSAGLANDDPDIATASCSGKDTSRHQDQTSRLMWTQYIVHLCTCMTKLSTALLI